MILGVYEQTGDRPGCGRTCRRSNDTTSSGRRRTARDPRRRPVALLTISATGPAPEVLCDEKDAKGRTHYDRVREYYRTHEVTTTTSRSTTTARADRLTDLFYKGDRSMRESGFDPSNRFGAFSVDDHRLRAGLPQHAALSDGRGRGADLDDARRRTRRPASGAAARASRRASDRPVSCGTRRPGSTSTTTSETGGAAATISRRRSTRCGRASRRRQQAARVRGEPGDGSRRPAGCSRARRRPATSGMRRSAGRRCS